MNGRRSVRDGWVLASVAVIGAEVTVAVDGNDGGGVSPSALATLAPFAPFVLLLLLAAMAPVRLAAVALGGLEAAAPAPLRLPRPLSGPSTLPPVALGPVLSRRRRGGEEGIF